MKYISITRLTGSEEDNKLWPLDCSALSIFSAARNYIVQNYYNRCKMGNRINTAGWLAAEPMTSMLTWSLHSYSINQLELHIKWYWENCSDAWKSLLDLVNRKWHTCLPKEKGMYRYLIMCRIWRFIVRTNRTTQYSRRIGQNTGTSNILKNVNMKATTNAFVNAYLHSTKKYLSHSHFHFLMPPRAETPINLQTNVKRQTKTTSRLQN